jgi:hypothetical protein
MTQEERDAFIDALPDRRSLRVRELQTVECDTINEKLEFGKIYVSRKFGVAIHLCACGWCCNETVTPFHEHRHDIWQLMSAPGQPVTLEGSIGNYNMPCKSHYFVRNGKVEWLSGLDCFGNEEGAT